MYCVLPLAQEVKLRWWTGRHQSAIGEDTVKSYDESVSEVSWGDGSTEMQQNRKQLSSGNPMLENGW